MLKCRSCAASWWTVIGFSFFSTEEKEQDFNQGLLNLGEIEELKID